MDRRQFMKFTAATGATASLTACGNPEYQLAHFIPEEDLVPGIATWKPSICPLCSAGCGVIARVMEGEAEVVRNGKTGLLKMGVAKKLEGNPAHAISQGRLCARGQAAIQITYHPDRIRTPLRRVGPRGASPLQEISWEAALADLKARLDKLAADGNQKSAAFLTRPLRGVRQDLVSRFLSGFGAAPAIEYEFFGNDVLRQANLRSFGREQLPTVDLAQSRHVISFGADFLGVWNSPVAQSIGYGAMRKGVAGTRGKLVQVEPRMSQTGANADEWIPAKPGTEGVLALGLAYAIMKKPGYKPSAAAARAGAQIEGWTSGMAAYAPAEVEKVTGVKADRIERIAMEITQHGPAVALIAGAPLAHSNGMFQALAVNALNAVCGSVGQPGGIVFSPQLGAGPRAQRASLEKFAGDILAAPQSPVQLLLLYEANPVYSAPPGWRVKDALAKIPYIVSFGNFLDETSSLADLILPDHSFLESWVDHVPESGSTVAIHSVAPPAMSPLHQTRAMPDVLLDVSRSLAKPLTPALPQTYEEMLKAAFSSLPAPKPKSPDEQPVDAWTAAQKQGGWWGETQGRAESSSPTPPANRRPAAYTAAEFDGNAQQFPFYFLPYASQQFLDGSSAHLPWLQEMPDVLTTAMWTSWVEINPQTASRLGIVEGDLVEVTSAHGSLRSPALIFPGIAPDVIAMPMGQGHENFTRYASGRGASPATILGPVVEAETSAHAWADTRVKIAKVQENGGLILFAGGMRENETEHR